MQHAHARAARYAITRLLHAPLKRRLVPDSPVRPHFTFCCSDNPQHVSILPPHLPCRSNQLHAALQQLATAHRALAPEDADSAREEISARSKLESLLAASQPPNPPTQFSDHVDVNYDQGHGQPLTMAVNQAQAGAGVGQAQGNAGVGAGVGSGQRGSLALGLPAP